MFDRRRTPRASQLGIALGTAWTLLIATPVHATFHLAHISEVLTSYGGDPDVQFVEITMDSVGQNFTAGTQLNTFDAAGNFVTTVLTVPAAVASGAGRPWIMGSAGFETATGLVADFAFADGALPVDGGMICWGKPGNSPAPVSCPGIGTPYVDCIAYGTYSGPTNDCVGTPTPLAPVGHSLRSTSATHDNANDFVCADPADPENNAGDKVEMAATTPCGVATTTTTIAATTTVTTRATTTSLRSTTTTMPTTVCGDANGDETITASDALAALRTAVGTGTCSQTRCDVDQNGSISASDALRILRRAVGNPVDLVCPSA